MVVQRSDLWLPSAKYPHIHSPSNLGVISMPISVLIDAKTRQWNLDVLTASFEAQDV